jgi:hypothetical protein
MPIIQKAQERCEAAQKPTWLELQRHISVSEAAQIKGLSRDGFERHYSHLIRQLSPRRVGVKLEDLVK